jgi:hypothetical protein
MITIFVRGGVVESVTGTDDYEVVDYDNLETGICPTCSEELEDGCCAVCGTDWEEEEG